MRPLELEGSIAGAWNDLVREPVALIGGAVLGALVGAATFGLLAPAMTVGLCGLALKVARGEAAAPTDVFEGLRRFWGALGVGLLVCVPSVLTVGCGLLASVGMSEHGHPNVIVPLLAGALLSAPWMLLVHWLLPFTGYFLAEGVGAVKSVFESSSLCGRRPLASLVFVLIAALLAYGGTLSTVCWLATVPLSASMLAHGYLSVTEPPPPVAP